jgi:hypothetical protein
VNLVGMIAEWLTYSKATEELEGNGHEDDGDDVVEGEDSENEHDEGVNDHVE